MLAMIIVVNVAPRTARADANADKQTQVEMAFDQYPEAKTEDQRTAIVDFLQHFDRKLVAGALIDHIVGSHDGSEATIFSTLIEGLGPDGCAVLMDRLGKTDDAVAKGKLIVAMRHCQGDDAVKTLAACLNDTRAVLFEAKGAHPRRVCDLAYDELYLKLRTDARYGLDAGPGMKGLITEKLSVKWRDALIAKLKGKMTEAGGTAAPGDTPSGAPAATPVPGG